MEAKYGDFGSEQFYYSALSKAKNDKTGKMTAIHLYNCEYGSKIYPKNKKTIFSTRKALEKQSFYLCNSCADIDVGQIMDQVKVLPIATRCEITENLNIEFLNTPHIPGSCNGVNSNNSNQTVLYGDLAVVILLLPRQAQSGNSQYAIIEEHMVFLTGIYL